MGISVAWASSPGLIEHLSRIENPCCGRPHAHDPNPRQTERPRVVARRRSGRRLAGEAQISACRWKSERRIDRLGRGAVWVPPGGGDDSEWGEWEGEVGADCVKLGPVAPECRARAIGKIFYKP